MRLKQVLVLFALLLIPESILALSDNLTLTVTDSRTSKPATFLLQRYNLRSANYQVRVYSDATTYSVLPSSQLPEVTTYRGRVSGDPEAFVCGAFAPNGRFYFNVSYGCRWQATAANSDPYDTTNRLSWGGWDYSVPTTNIPSLGYSYIYQTNMPAPVSWSANNYPAPVAISFGGPPFLNNLQRVPLQRVRLVLDSDLAVFNGIGGGDIATTILMQEARINDLDYLQARDVGLCYRIVTLCVRPNTQSPYHSSGFGKLADLNSFWRADPGYLQTFDMVHGTVNIGGGGVAYSPGDFSVMDPSWAGNAVSHEVGHNWGQGHYASSWDYTGDNFWHVTMSGSGYGHGIADVAKAQDLRRNSAKGNLEWVRYNYPLAPWAGADSAVTKFNQPVTVDVLLNDRVASSNTLSIVSIETNTPAGGVVTNLGNGQLKYTPPSGFLGYDLFHYYVGENSGFKSLTGVKILVTNDANSLLAQWNFNETNGATATEATGSGVPGFLNGTANFTGDSVPGIGGGSALHLDGNGYVRFKGTWFDPLNASMSLSLWCKPDAAPTGEQMLLMKSSLNGNGSSGFRIGMNGASFFCSGATLGALKPFSVSAPITPLPGTWYHLVVAFDRTSNLVRLWVNGTEYTGTSNTRSIPAGEFIIGENWPVLGAVNSSSGWGNYFVGAIDDLRLYTKTLSLTEITSLYQSAGHLPAGGPTPSDGERDVPLLPTLKWVAGRTNYQHDIFLGTNLVAITKATLSSAEYAGRRLVGNYTPPTALMPNTEYFWRVDEVINGTNVAPGAVWSFRTAVDAIHGGLKLQLTLNSRDTVGNVTYDRAGPPFNDATLFSTPPSTSGRVAEAFEFDGVGQYAEVPPLNLTTDTMTLLAWVRRNGQANDYSGLVFHRGSSASGLNVTTANRLGYHWNNAANTYNFNSGLTLPDGQWALVALVVQTNRAIAFLGTTNGVLAAATNNVTHGLATFDSPLRLASDSTSSGRFFKGALDEIAVWNRALTRAEIGTILTNGVAGGGIDGPPPLPEPGTFTWTGATDPLWNNSANWAAGAVPSTTDTIFFDDSSARNLSTELAQNFSVAGAVITGRLRGLGIAASNGHSLSIGSGGILLSNSFTALTVAAPLALTGKQEWSVSEFASINVRSNVSVNAHTLTLTGGGSFTLGGVLNGVGGLIKTGAGEATLTAGSQTFRGNLVVSNGTLKAFGGQWAQSFFGNVTPRGITVQSNATLVTTTHSLGGLGAAFYQPTLTLNEGATWKLDAEQYLSGGNLLLKGATISILANDLRLQGGTVNVAASPLPTRISGAGSITLFGATTFNVADGALASDCNIDVSVGSSGVQSLTKSGAGTMSMTKISTYTGATILSAGTLSLLGGKDTLPATTSLTINSGATLALNHQDQSIAGLSGSGAIGMGHGVLNVSIAGNNTFAGIISGSPLGSSGDTPNPGGLTKSGVGRLTLTANQIYSGDTYIIGGTLALSGNGGVTASSNIVVAATLDATASPGGVLTLAAGQTLKGNGVVLGAVSVTSGSAISPGGSVGTLTTGAETWLGGGNYQWEINHATLPESWDSLAINGSLTIGATAGNPFVLRLVSPGGVLPGFNTASNHTWTVATTTDGVIGFDPAKIIVDSSGLGANLAGGNFAVQTEDPNLVLTFIANVAPPRITGAAILTGGLLSFTGTGIASRDYVLNAAANLTAPITWTPIITNTSDTNGFFEFTDPQAANHPQRFYRVTLP